MAMKKLLKEVLKRSLSIYKKAKYRKYNSIVFCDGLEKVSIVEGDNVFVICSTDNLTRKIGETPPIHKILKDIIDTIGPKGTILALAFSKNRDKIISGEEKFHWKKTSSNNGILTELLRRKKESVRSYHPIYSAVAYGPKAEQYCNDHHKGLYPFGKHSPYRKIIEDGGKYLGIGLDFNQFTPVHVLDDYYEDKFIHNLFQRGIRKFEVIGKNEIISMGTFIRKTGKDLKDEIPNPDGEAYFKKLQPIKHYRHEDNSGIDLFVMDMKSFFYAALKNYDNNKLTWWNTEA